MKISARVPKKTANRLTDISPQKIRQPRSAPTSDVEKRAGSISSPNAVLQSQIVKATISEDAGHIILVRSLRLKDGTISKSTLVKMEISRKNGIVKYGKHRGLNINDLLVVKRNWSQILKAMVS